MQTKTEQNLFIDKRNAALLLIKKFIENSKDIFRFIHLFTLFMNENLILKQEGIPCFEKVITCFK